MIRTGLLFRNERHIPFSRIQNLDAVQHVFHRLFDVVEVRVETGGGGGAEEAGSACCRAPRSTRCGGACLRAATRRTRPRTRRRRRWPTRRARRFCTCRRASCCCAASSRTRAWSSIGAAYGLLWETGWLRRMFEGMFGSGFSFGRGILRELTLATFDDGPWPVGRLAIAMLGLLGLLLLVRLLSMAWAFLRLYDFRLIRAEEDLRIQFGLLTRVTATIPIRRIQTITIREGLLHRALRRASVRVDTAGGTETETVTRDRDVAGAAHRQAGAAGAAATRSCRASISRRCRGRRCTRARFAVR